MQSSVETDDQQAVHALFARLAARAPDPALRTVTGTWQFDIDNCGRWYVTVADGSVSVSRDPVPADCAVAGQARDFLDVLEGRQSVFTTYLQGRLRASGNLGLGLKFRRLLPVRP